MKKIVAILLAILVFSGLSVACPAATVTVGKTIELLKNGSFEELKNSVTPSVWSLDSQKWGDIAKLETNSASDGNRMLHVTVPAGSSEQFAQSLSGLATGVEYTLHFSQHGTVPSGVVQVGFEYYYSSSYCFDTSQILTRADWWDFELKFTPPAGVTTFTIRVVLPGESDTYWDNFSLTIPAPKNENGITPYESYIAPLDFYEQAPISGADNLLSNGNFDSVSNGQVMPENWGMGSNNGTVLGVDATAPGNEGNNCIKLQTRNNYSEADLRYLPQVRTINFPGNPGLFKPNTRYRLSLRSYCDGRSLPPKGDGNLLSLTVYYYVGNGTEPNPIGSVQNSYNLGPSKPGAWEEHAVFFTAPENTTSISLRLYFRTNNPLGTATYTIWVDDVALQQAEEENYAALHPDQVFYYAEDSANVSYENQTGFARLRVYPEHIADCAGGTVNFKLMNADKTQTLAQKTGVALSDNNTATFSYPLLGMEVSGYQAGEETGQNPTEKPYLLIAEVYNQNGELKDTVMRAIYRYRRPEHMNIDGELLDEDGEIFIPTIAYSAPVVSIYPSDEYPHPDMIRTDMLEELGINMPVLSSGLVGNRYSSIGQPTSSNALRLTLDALAEKGMKGIVSFFPLVKHGAHPDEYYRTIATIQEFKDHPGVGAWNLADEPWDKIMEQEYWLTEMYKLVRRYDDKHPIFFTDNSLYIEYSSMYSDMVSMDPYPSYPMNSGTSLFPETDRFASCISNPAVYAGEATALLHRTTERYGKHILQVQPGFAYNGYLPSISDLRSFWYQTIFEDGHANGWYTLCGGNGIYPLSNGSAKLNGNTLPAKPQYLEWLEEFGEEELPMSYLLFGRSSPYPQFNRLETAEYAYESVAANGDLYVLVWNRKAAVQSINVSLTSQNGLVTAYGTPTELYHFSDPDVPADTGCNPVSNNGILTVTLQPAAFGLIRIPCAVVDTDVLFQSSFDDIGSLDSSTKTAVEVVWREGIMDAENRTFAPSEKMTRGDFTKALMRALDLECLSSRGKLVAQFSDVSSSAPYAREVQVARSLGILKGNGNNTCSPTVLISGAEAKILCERALAVAIRTFDAYGSFGTGTTITKAETAVLMNNLHQLQKGAI